MIIQVNIVTTEGNDVDFIGEAPSLLEAFGRVRPPRKAVKAIKVKEIDTEEYQRLSRIPGVWDCPTEREKI